MINTTGTPHVRKHFAYRTTCKEVSPVQVNLIFQLDFQVAFTDRKASYEDQRFLQKMNTEVQITADGHYQLPLPFKSDLSLPKNQAMAESRLQQLRRRIKKDTTYKQYYTDFMSKFVEKCYTETVPTTELEVDGRCIWYLPHHGVYHPKKNQTRVVFDCSSIFGGYSLNQILMQSP